MSFPDIAFRGLSEKNAINTDGTINSSACQFNDENRPDGWRELSITWNDNDDAIQIVFSQRKDGDGSIQFKAGVAELLRANIDHHLKVLTIKDKVSYERQPIEDNPYHGNILVHKDLKKNHVKMMSSLIGFASRKVHPNPNS